jgi:ribosomal protein S16
MSVGSNLQEMENVVTKGAKPADPMPKLDLDTPGQTASWEDLGGPTPENYKSDDDSAKLKEPAVTLSQVKDVVNKGAKPADPMKKMSEEADDEEEEVTEEELESEEILETDEEDTEEEYDIEEDVNALLEGEDLSEEFQEKARTIFEAAIKAKVAEIKEQLQSQYEESLVEQIVSIKEELTDRVDAYLEYVADEWIQENALAVEHGLKTEMTESFLSGMKSLFEDHYVTIPEDRYDVIESMVDKLDEMEAKLNEQIERNVALNRRLAESVADVIFAEVAEGLALSQKDKLASLAENVEFESEEDYREKLVTLRESYFPTNAGTQRDASENLSEESANSDYQPVSGLMESYLQSLKRVSKK